METAEKESLNIESKASNVSNKDIEKIVKKIEAIIAMGMVATIPVNTPIDVVTLGESGNLSKSEQVWFDKNFKDIRLGSGVEESIDTKDINKKSFPILATFNRDKGEINDKEEGISVAVMKPKRPGGEMIHNTEKEEIDAPIIEGLVFDREDKIYTAEANNPYGLEAGVEAGVFVKDAVEINGEIQDAVGLVGKVIEFKQKDIYKNTKDYSYPIPFDLKLMKRLRINELEVKEFSEQQESNFEYKCLAFSLSNSEKFWDFYFPLSKQWRFSTLSYHSENDNELTATYDIHDFNRQGSIAIYIADHHIVSSKEFINSTKDDLGNEGESFGISGHVGDLFGGLSGEDHLEIFNNELDWIKFSSPDKYQLGMFLFGRDRSLNGVDRLLSIKSDSNKEQDNVKVFILSRESIKNNN